MELKMKFIIMSKLKYDIKYVMDDYNITVM